MFRLLPLLLLIIAFTARAAAPTRGADMNYGPFLCYTVQSSHETTCKGITVSLAAGTNRAAVVFDTDTLRYATAWSGGWLDLTKTHLTTEKGELPPRVAGKVEWSNQPGPGWAKGGSWTDPRTNHIGPLPKEWAHYKGLFRHGSNTVFHYTVDGCEVFDVPGLIESEGFGFFTRTLRIAPNTRPMMLRLRDTACETLPSGAPCPSVVVLEGKDVLPRLNANQIEAAIPPHAEPLTIKFLFVDSEHGQAIPFEHLDRIHAPDLPDVIRGGPALWPQTITTTGKRSADSAAFVVDTVAIPENNPWRSWMRLTALDFFSDGRAAIATWSGDVWIVSGLDDSLQNVKWKRFAAGLFDPLGLKIVRDEIYVLERSQITRLRDLNNDGEADVYENFNNDTAVSPSYHAFAMDLQTDSAGNFYFARAGQRVEPIYPLNGGMVRVSADGSRAELIAHGLRVVNGMAIGPRDEIVCSDNQGNWIPSGRIDWIDAKQPGFYGYVPHAHGLPTNRYVPPLCWIPMAIDNSGGSQVFVTSDKWPASLKNQILHSSYGMASLLVVLWETNSGVAQGGVMKLPLKFDSGIMRPRFNPADGQLYIAGLRGWQTKVARDGALQRVRWTGKPPRMPSALHVRRNGIEITFTDPLDRVSAEDLQNWNVEQWNYLWSDKYGSDDYSVSNPAKKGRDSVEVRRIKLSSDNKSVLLEIAELKPVMQMKIKFALQSADGEKVAWEIYITINRVPAQ
ncbi:MAG TPA: DUF6797 domain-containing protein [Candidatus Acidoferrum sp.]|nr:DUF6797 domain-containing protein [Candidatus Acidoferrum sp.]